MNINEKITSPFLRMMACVALIGGSEVKGVGSALNRETVTPSVSDTAAVGMSPDTGSAMVTGTKAAPTNTAVLTSTATPASLSNAASLNAAPAHASGAPNAATEKTETDAAGARDAAGAALAASSKDLTQLIQQVKQTPLTMDPRAASSMSPQPSPETGLRSPESSRSVDGNASASSLPSDEPLMPTPVDGPDGGEGGLNEGELLDGEQDPAMPSADPIGTPKAPNQVVIPAFTQPIPEQQPAVDAAMKKPTLGCTDILMQSQCFIDPSIKVAYTYVYTLCLMEFSLQKYLESQQYMANNVRTLEEPAQASLKEIQRVLPSAILGYKLVSDLFQSGQLRDLLDNARQQYQDTKHLNP